MNFKHTDTQNAYNKAVALHSLVATINDELARAKELYRPERYQQIEAEKRTQFREAMHQLEDSVAIMKKNLTSIVQESERKALIENSKDPYIQILNSGAILTAHELALILDQNPNNNLLLRAADKYANDKNIGEDLEFKKAKAKAMSAQHREVTPLKCVENLAEYVIKYSPDERAFNNPSEQKNKFHLFSVVNNDDHKLLEKLDNSI